MAYQTNPIGLRLIKTRDWDSKWSVNLINNQELYGSLLHEDLLIKNFIKQICFKNYIQIGRLIIKRSFNQIYIVFPINYDQNFVKTTSINNNKQNDLKIIHKLNFFKLIQYQIENFTNVKVYMFMSKVTTIATSAQLVANNLAHLLTTKRKISAYQLSKQIALLKKNTLQAEILGYKVQIAGRLNGANRARTVQFKDGKMPLNTIDTTNNQDVRIKIDYATSTVYTKHGTLGIKVWTSRKQKGLE